MISMNEEEIRGKLLLPYLNDLGLDLSEISLETSFTIRLGKTQHAIKGRSDILCKRNGKNLFIIELKRESIAISQKDIDQGISYARALLDEIAPFVIITNGKTTRVFDSISRLDLTGMKLSEVSDFWKNGYTLSVDEELRIRYEALKNFVSLSTNNLKLFCSSQVQDRMGPIIGPINDPNSKFVKELYVQRKNLQSSFDNFINAKASCFAIVGAAGVGKTNTLCALALQCLESDFVFFYNAAIINRSPLEHIAQDLNGVFSNKQDGDLVLKRLNEMGRFLGKNVFIFIDAIDENTNNNLSLELSEMAFSAKNLDRVKICISCKSNIWSSVLKVNDTPTHLFEELIKFHNRLSSLSNNPGFLLEDFSEEELMGIAPLYRKAFGFMGEISKKLIKELRNGFFLRIFSEVYSHKQVPEQIDDKNLIRAYLKQSFEKSKIDFQTGIRILSRVGKALMNHKYSPMDSHLDTGLDIEVLLEKLKLDLNENLPEDFFARNILTKSNKKDSYHISFYYSKIRDYVICFHSYKLDKLDDKEFYNVLEKFYRNYIGQSAIELYLENAIESHKHTLIRFKKDKALSYVETYSKYLDENFKNFKRYFNPGTDDDIGIELPIDLIKKSGYALFAITPETSEKVIQENLRDGFSDDFWGGRMRELRVTTLYGSHYSLMVNNQEKAVKKIVLEQLKDIVLKGKLNAYNSEILLMEQVALIVYYYQKQLGYDSKFEDFYMPRFELIYPMDLQELQTRIQHFRAFEHFRQNDYTTPRSTLRQLAEDAVRNNLEIPRMRTTGDFPPFEELSKIILILQQKGHKVLEKHHLPYPNISVAKTKDLYWLNNIRNVGEIRSLQYSDEQAKLYVESFFRHVESCYRDFVDYLFPTFKHALSFYKGMPHEYFFYTRDSEILKWGSMGYRPSSDGQIKFNFKGNMPMGDAFKTDGVSKLQGFSLDKILRSSYHNDIKTIDKYNTPKVNEFCAIRNWVYKLIKDDMRDEFKEFKIYI
jgi:hypothetical protein